MQNAWKVRKKNPQIEVILVKNVFLINLRFLRCNAELKINRTIYFVERQKPITSTNCTLLFHARLFFSFTTDGNLNIFFRYSWITVWVHTLQYHQINSLALAGCFFFFWCETHYYIIHNSIKRLLFTLKLIGHRRNKLAFSEIVRIPKIQKAFNENAVKVKWTGWKMCLSWMGALKPTLNVIQKIYLIICWIVKCLVKCYAYLWGFFLFSEESAKLAKKINMGNEMIA